jgi:hypothetical protein
MVRLPSPFLFLILTPPLAVMTFAPSNPQAPKLQKATNSHLPSTLQKTQSTPVALPPKEKPTPMQATMLLITIACACLAS